MKRYRLLTFDFDTRSESLEEVQDDWDEEYKKLHESNRAKIMAGLVEEYGELNREQKIQNFIDIGRLHFSFYAFHNRFLREIRNSYVIGSCYPALTAACSLGERLLNHMILLLRDSYKDTPQYKRVYRKGSFDNWDTVIDTLQTWGVLREGVREEFHNLKAIRNMSIHFNYETERHIEKHSLDAVKLIQKIVRIQFSYESLSDSIFICNGEIYVKSDVEQIPFIRMILLPQSGKVGPYHSVESQDGRNNVLDDQKYRDEHITDSEFYKIRINHLYKGGEIPRGLETLKE